MANEKNVRVKDQNTRGAGQGAPASASSAPENPIPQTPEEWAKITAAQINVSLNNGILVLREGEEMKVLVNISEPVLERTNKYGNPYYLVPIVSEEYKYVLVPKTALKMLLRRMTIKKSNEVTIRHIARGKWDVT